MERIKPYGFDELKRNPYRLRAIELKKELEKIYNEYWTEHAELFRIVQKALCQCFPSKYTKIHLDESAKEKYGVYDRFLVVSKKTLGFQHWEHTWISGMDLNKDNHRKLLIYYADEIKEKAKKTMKERASEILDFLRYLDSKGLNTDFKVLGSEFELVQFEGEKKKRITVLCRNSRCSIASSSNSSNFYWREELDFKRYHDCIDYYYKLPEIVNLLRTAISMVKEKLALIKEIKQSDEFLSIKDFVMLYDSLSNL